MKAWYSKAGSFKDHADFFKEIYSKEWGKLLDLNVTVTKYLLSVLGIDKKIYFESELGVGGEKTQRIINIGKKLKADTYLSGSGGRDYLESDKFQDAKIKLVYQDFCHPVYKQLFGAGEKDFIVNLSIVDLLFNEGDRSLGIIRSVNPNVKIGY
jgi:hypothetical protein